MYISHTILKNFQEDIIIENIPRSFLISDCILIKDFATNYNIIDENVLCWVNSNSIRDVDLSYLSGIILLDEKLFVTLKSEKFKNIKLLVSRDPRQIYQNIVNLFENENIIYEKHPTAIINPNSIIGNNVYIGANSVINECKIANNCIIHDNCFIGKGVEINEGTEIHSGARIGLSVFGFEKNYHGKWVKYPQIGGVQIGKYVTIGANTCISNGFLKSTIIEDNVAIDNLCQIGASVNIRNNTKIAANSFIASYTKIGVNCWISPSVSIRENLIISDDVFIGIGSVVLRNIKLKGSHVFGNPAKQI